MTWISLRNLAAGIVPGVLLMACTVVPQGKDPVPPGQDTALEFMPEGRVRGAGGCNAYDDRYTSSDDQLEIGPVGATRHEGQRLELRTATGALAVTMTSARADTTAPAGPPR